MPDNYKKILIAYLEGVIGATEAQKALGYKSLQSLYNLLNKEYGDYKKLKKPVVKDNIKKSNKKTIEIKNNNRDKVIQDYISGTISLQEATNLLDITSASFYNFMKRHNIDYSSRPKNKRGRKLKYVGDYEYSDLLKTKIAGENIDFDTWRSKLVTIISLYSEKSKIKFPEAMKRIQKRVTEKYGIVWEEEKKKFIRKYNKLGSTLEYAYLDPDTRSITYAVAINMVEELNRSLQKDY